MLCQDNNIKLWLGLIEEWLNDADNVVPLKTAKAAAGTLAMSSCDLQVATALGRNSCVETFVSVLRADEQDMIHRVLVTILEMLSNEDSQINNCLKQPDLLLALCELDVDEERQGLIREIGRLLS
jgi:hypothetical protein